VKRTAFLNHEFTDKKTGIKYRNGIQFWPPREIKFEAATIGNKLAQKWCINVTTELKPGEEEDEETGTKSGTAEATKKPALAGLGMLKGMLNKKPKISVTEDA